MNDSAPTKEQRILRAVKLTLFSVIRDTGTPAHLQHPLSDTTIEDLRQCLALISARERELAEAAGETWIERPRYVDEPAPPKQAVVRFSKPVRNAPEDS
ncbi:MAG: segregation and condensation protein A [Casimicrobiaceae bacterium]